MFLERKIDQVHDMNHILPFLACLFQTLKVAVSRSLVPVDICIVQIMWVCLAARYLSNTARAPGVRVIYLLHCRVCTYTATAGCRLQVDGYSVWQNCQSEQSQTSELSQHSTVSADNYPFMLWFICRHLFLLQTVLSWDRAVQSKPLLTLSIKVLRLTLNNGTEQTVFVCYRYIY